MKRLSDTISPLSWLVLAAGFLPTLFFFVFRPTILEFVVFLVVDTIAFSIVKALDDRFGDRFFPDSSAKFLDFDPAAVPTQPAEAQTKLLERMMRFPARRAQFCLISCYFKAIPAYVVVVFFWVHTESNATQALKLLLLCSLMYSYYYGVVYIENHAFLSAKMREFHARYDWSEVFRRAPAPLMRSEFIRHESVSLVAIWVFMLTLQFLAIQRDGAGAFAAAGIGFAGLFLSFRVWSLGRQYFIGGLESIFDEFERFDPAGFRPMLALHSAPLLARFDATFNTLVERLRGYEQELSRWIFAQTERSRYHALGEISGLVVHDLSGPLHVLSFCSEALKENPELIRNEQYLRQLSENSRRSLELVNSVKSYLKSPKAAGTVAKFEEAHAQVVRLLEVQFAGEQYARVRFSVAPDALSVELSIGRADLIHVLYNLYRNAVENLLVSDVERPEICISVRQSGDGFAVLRIADNGSGLSAERFEALTAFVYSPTKPGFSREGLGLRLIRRIVERADGTLSVDDSARPPRGTAFHLKLRQRGAAECR